MFEAQVRRLVEAFNTNNTSEIELDRTIRKTARLLSSNTQYHGHESFQHMVQKISDSLGHQQSLYFMDKAKQLQSCPHLTKQSELLQLLESLTHDDNNNKKKKNKPLIINKQRNAMNIIRPYANDTLQREQYKTDLSMTPIHRLDAPYNLNFEPRGLKGEMVDELLLISDILYSCQGIQTKLMISNLRLLPSQKRLIRRLCSLGDYHLKLNKFIGKHRDSKCGLVLQSFLGCLEEEVISLYELFGCLHEKLQISFNRQCKTEEKMTLERLNIWFAQPLKRLSLLNKFCCAIDGASGCMIISQIYKFCRTGNAFEEQLTQSILNDICRPIFDMITRWIVEGALNDPFDEFFIILNEKESDIWKNKYILIRTHIPIFINKRLAKQIFCIGRNLNFIHSVTNITNKLIHSFVFDINLSHLSEFEANINTLSEMTNKYLMDLMMNKFKVMTHAQALRKYLLLCQGDFVQQFLIEIRDQMSKNASFIKVHDMENKLESAILNTNALYDDNDVKQRLKVKLLATNGGDIGWNVFTLNYDVSDLPINIIFTPNIMKKYQKVFVFLMKIKLAKSVLNDCWKYQMKGNHIVSIFPDIHYIKHCAHLVRNSMNELLQIFESYFMFDVLDASWKTFQQNANSPQLDIDGLIQSHSTYIHQILTKCFLLKKPLQDILQQIHEFTTMYKELYHSLQKIQSERDKKLLNPNIQYDVYDNDYQSQYQLLRKKQNEIIYVLKSFHNKIAKLLQWPKANKIIPEYLERLLVQLDFNDFHSNANNHTLAIDLPIHPLPLESFTNHCHIKNSKYKEQHSAADNMLSKLDAVLNTNTTKPFIPNFVFPKLTSNQENDANANNNKVSTYDNNNKYNSNTGNDAVTSYTNAKSSDTMPSYGQNTATDVLSKYDSAIPQHFLPTPLQKKTSAKTSDGNKAPFDFSYNKNTNYASSGMDNIASPSSIKFSFDSNTDKTTKQIMSPIPFSRNIGDLNKDDSDKNKWDRFIPTPLINEAKKTKSYR
eukprot:255479_1